MLQALSNWRIGSRLAGGFGLLLTAQVLLLGLFLHQMSGMASRVQQIGEVGLAELTTFQHTVNDINARAVAARNLVVDPDSSKSRSYVDAIVRHNRDIEAGFNKLEQQLRAHASSDQDELLRRLAELRELERRYLPITQAVAEAVLAQRRGEAAERLIRDCKPLLDQILTRAGEFERKLESASNELVSAARSDLTASRVQSITMAALCVGLGVLVAWLLTTSLVRPIREAVQVARTVADGDLTSRIEVRSRDETGELLGALKTMVDNLSRVVSGVRSASDTIALGVGEIANGNADLSHRTESQASNLEETAASMEQINATVKNNADTAQEASRLASAATDAARRGGEAMGQVVNTMDEISSSSRRIVDIISVIDGIAFQTNILALNAAVEAARAGEQGRGFAVVAGEVRVLAQRSAAAAKEIKQLIAASAERVDDGARLVSGAGQAMEDILQKVNRVNDLIGEINSATGQQASGISQINVAIAQLDQNTQQNAALVEQSAAAAESLRQQTAQLVEAVGAFRVSDGATVHTLRPSAGRHGDDRLASLPMRGSPPALPA